MTEQHPLTDEMMYKIHGNRPGYSNPFDEDDMRAAADWQLEQVIEHILAAAWFAKPKYRIAELRAAMRPQQQQQENNYD